jgi:8-oxo-dGTP pyrophosphatase MutT (NUDIX family)
MISVSAFIICIKDDAVCATTRDKGIYPVGLPGGKVEKGETPLEAALRESKEEGWLFKDVNPTPIYEGFVEGNPVVFFYAKEGNQLAQYKEKYRGIKPVLANKEVIQEQRKYLNDKALQSVEKMLSEVE